MAVNGWTDPAYQKNYARLKTLFSCGLVGDVSLSALYLHPRPPEICLDFPSSSCFPILSLSQFREIFVGSSTDHGEHGH